MSEEDWEHVLLVFRAEYPLQSQREGPPAFFARALYKARGRIEQGFDRLKGFKRVTL